MRNFRVLSDPAKININPDRIRIHNAGESDSLENLLRSAGVPKGNLKEVALLNGKDLKEAIPPNAMFKVIERGR